MKKIKIVLFSLMVMFLGLNNVFAKWTCEMEPKTLNITVGQTVKILAKQTGDEILRTLPTYTSANSSVVSVDISGNVKGVKAGTTTVSGSYGAGYECGTTTITVSASQDEWSGEMIPTTLSLGVGETGKVTARQTGGIVANTLPTYTSSNPNVATVDSNGNVKAIAAGSTIITGKFGNLVAGTTTVTVKKTASEWTGEMTPKTLSLNVGETGKVTARQTGDIQANTLPTYTSSNTNVATVDSNGNVKAIAAGTTVITGKFGNLVAGTTTVTVTKLEWTGEMTPKTLTITVGETGRVTAKQTGNLIIKTLATYESSNPSIASVDNDGNVKGLKVGTVTITGRFGSYVAGTTTVTVKEKGPEWTGEMTPETLKLAVGETGQVKATQTGDIHVNTFATYESSDTSVATVDKNGNVKAIKVGSAIITGKFGTLVAGKTVVIVGEGETWTGSMEPEKLTLVIGDVAYVKARQTGGVQVNTFVTYVSSNPNVASVDGTGKVTALAKGTTIITGKFGDLVAGTTTVTVEDLTVVAKWTGTTQTEKNSVTVGNTTVASVVQQGDTIVDSEIEYISSDTSVATVDKNGVVSAIKPGTAIITAKVGNNLEATGTAITVTESAASIGESLTNSVYVIGGSIIIIILGAVLLLKCRKKNA